jgi:hypothetical protein
MEAAADSPAQSIRVLVVLAEIRHPSPVWSYHPANSDKRYSRSKSVYGSPLSSSGTRFSANAGRSKFGVHKKLSAPR